MKHKEKIPKRAPRCSVCETPFIAGSIYISALVGEERTDFCEACWEKADQSRFEQHWKGKIPHKLEKKLTPDERALELFKSEEDPQLLAVLALYLQRREQVVKRSSTKKVEHYEIPETGEVITIDRIILSPEEGRAAGEKLVERLNAAE